MKSYVLGRLGHTVIVAVALSLVCYYILTLMPGDPVDLMISANPKITPADVDRLRRLYGLDQPFYTRYFHWLTEILSGDLGFSRTYKIPVSDLIFGRLLNTFILSMTALILSLCLAIPLGVYSAVHHNSKIDYIINIFSFIGISVPSFWLALVLIIVFSVTLGLFPASGTDSVSFASNTSLIAIVFDRISYLVLPVVSLSLMQIGSFVRYTRASMLEALRNDFVRTARAKGLSQSRVILVHALRNALLPLITVVALSFSSVFSGAIITETVFAYRGVGKLVFESIQSNDFNVAMIAFMISILMVLIMNLLADILYSVADPRVRL